MIAFNLARAAAAVAASQHRVRWATRRIINVPGRIAATGQRLVLHLPICWPWAQNWQALHTLAIRPPPTHST